PYRVCGSVANDPKATKDAILLDSSIAYQNLLGSVGASSAAPSAQNLKRLHRIIAVTVDDEIVVERNGLCDADPFHHSKGGAVDKDHSLCRVLRRCSFHTASPNMISLSRPTSVGSADAPIPKIAEMCGLS